MKTKLLSPTFLTAFFLVSICISLQAQTKSNKEIGFICAPCRCPEDTKFYEDPGACSVCGMERYAAYIEGYEPVRKQVTNAPRKTVAILLFNGVQIIDYTGPYEVFGQANWNVFTVAKTDTLITTAMGMMVKPHYSFENAPGADFLLLPGGGVNRYLNDEVMMNWIKEKVNTMEQTLSVCNGAYFLGAAGLLDGQKATTFAPLINGLRLIAPNANVVENERFTDNGKILTSAGLSSGIDAAIYLVSKYQGLGNAQRIVTNLEYDWNNDHGYVRASLADFHLSGFSSYITQFDRELIRYEGNNNHWTIEVNIKTNQSIKSLRKVISYQVVNGNGWKLNHDNTWSFETNNQTWKGVLSIKDIGEKKNLTFKVEKI